MIRLGTVGTSEICRQFVSGTRLTGRFDISAVYSRNKNTGEEFAEKIDAGKVFTDLNSMAESKLIDAVYIATPNALHSEQCKIFLNRGIHVICEKPLVTNSRELYELFDIADRNNAILMEAIIPRHVAHYDAVKKAVAGIGEIRMAKIDFCQRSSRFDSFLAGNHVNIFDMSLHAGALMDIGIYCVYAAVDLLGVPTSIKCDSSFLYNGADGSGSSIFNYGDFICDLTYSKTCDSGTGSELMGSQGTVRIEKISQYTGVTLIKDGSVTGIAGQISKEELMSGEALKFSDYILNLKTCWEDYRKSRELCSQVHRLMDTIKTKSGIIYPVK